MDAAIENAEYIEDMLASRLGGRTGESEAWRAFVSIMNEELFRRAEDSERRILAGGAFACYLSMEYLLGRLATQTLLNMRIMESARRAFAKLGFDMGKVLAHEPSTQLGNGGLGRLAACFFDSLATMDMPAFGYGLFYRCGIYKQEIVKGRQAEKPDLWWERENFAIRRRPDIAHDIKFGGKVIGAGGIERAKWKPSESVRASAADAMIAGYGTKTVLRVRLWDAERKNRRAPDIRKKIENITDFLYPPDTTPEGKRLRLRQEHVLVSASIQDMFERFRISGKQIEKIERAAKVQLNDTHPALAIPEIIRILMQQYNFGFDQAYEKTYRMCAYTNHTLMAEALEKIDIGLMRRELPLHLAIIERIDGAFAVKAAMTVAKSKMGQVAIIDRKNGAVNAGHLCIAATHKVNGVAKLHSGLLKKKEFRIFAQLFPGKFINETNGITQRRWLLQANPRLASLITETIGDGWITDLGRLKKLSRFKNDDGFLEKLWRAKQENKAELFDWIRRETGTKLDPSFMLDVQVKRIHEYKRQLLNIMHVIHRYNLIRDGRADGMAPRVCMFAGKAPPTYEAARDILSLIANAAEIINSDRRCKGVLKVVFVPNYNIDIAEKIVRAAELSEQISTAGKEASGTGNMKLVLNGALTMGTLDGANVEIANAVGRRNIFTFGLSAQQVYNMKDRGYDAQKYYDANPEIRRVAEQIQRGEFGRHRALLDAFFDDGDQYMLLPDFPAYAAAQKRADAIYGDAREWTRRSLINIAKCGFFSSDRAIGGYAKDIWRIKPVDEKRG